MFLITQGKASTLPYSPSRPYLCNLAKTIPRPRFFVDDAGRVKINVEHPEWIAILKKRGAKNPEKILRVPGKKTLSGEIKKAQEQIGKNKSGKNGKGKIPKLGAEEKELAELIKQSNRANLEEQILKNDIARYKIEQEKIKLKKEAGDVIEFDLASFLFFGYMEKVNIDLLGLCKKIEPIIDNLVKEKDTRGILKRLNREFEIILKEVIKAQAEDVEQWEKER